jgi:hypothetical protein
MTIISIFDMILGATGKIPLKCFPFLAICVDELAYLQVLLDIPALVYDIRP